MTRMPSHVLQKFGDVAIVLVFTQLRSCCYTPDLKRAGVPQAGLRWRGEGKDEAIQVKAS